MWRRAKSSTLSTAVRERSDADRSRCVMCVYVYVYVYVLCASIQGASSKYYSELDKITYQQDKGYSR